MLLLRHVCGDAIRVAVDLLRARPDCHSAHLLRSRNVAIYQCRREASSGDIVKAVAFLVLR